MPLQQLTLETLGQIDGGKGLAVFQRHLARAAADCEDRPNDKKARRVTLVVDIIPVPEDDGTCNEVGFQISSTSRVPEHKTKVYSGRLFKNGHIGINPDSLDNVNQTTFMGDDDL